VTSPVIFVLRDPDSGATEVRAFGCEPEMIVEIDLGRDDLSDPVVFDTWFGQHHAQAHNVAFRNPEAGAWYRDMLVAIRQRFQSVV